MSEEIIDAYTHYTPPSYLDLVSNSPISSIKKLGENIKEICSKYPSFIDPSIRIAHMDKFGISAQVTMIHNVIEPNMFNLDQNDLIKFCRSVNDGIAKVSNESKGRVFGLGSVPFNCFESKQSEKLAIDEMRQSIENGLKGFMVLTNMRGKPVDTFKSFWKEVDRLGVVVYLHPTNSPPEISRPYEQEYDLMHVLGWPYETTLILSRLIFTGVLQTNPNLRIVGHHMGGMMAFFLGRIAESYDKTSSDVNKGQKEEARRSGDSQEYIKNSFYYDTAVGGSLAAIKCGYEVFGAKQIIFATDYPWGPDGGTKRLSKYPDLVRSLDADNNDLDLIFSGNTRRLLRL